MNSFLTKLPRISNGERTISPVTGVEKIECPLAEEWNWTCISHHTQKANENRQKTFNVNSENVKLMEAIIEENLLATSEQWFGGGWYQNHKWTKRIVSSEKVSARWRIQPNGGPIYGMGENIFRGCRCKEAIYKVYKEFSPLPNASTNNPTRK